jgi:hypothetical protein
VLEIFFFTFPLMHTMLLTDDLFVIRVGFGVGVGVGAASVIDDPVRTTRIVGLE